MDAILKNNFKNILAGYQKVADYTVSGSAISSYDFTGLNITKEDDYILVSSLPSSSASDAIQLYINDNNTSTNYYHQYLYSVGSSVSSGRSTGAYSLWTDNGGFIYTNIKITNNGYYVWQSNILRSYGDYAYNINNLNVYGTSTFTVSSITKLTISHNTSSGIGIGSRFQLYKRVAPIIADITVSSATTSVDITGLSIDKGSEYMLVSDVVKGANGSTLFSLFANGNNTSTNYYHQRIYAGGTNITPVRENNARLLWLNDSSKEFSISNIKLTNDGYFVFQSSQNFQYGSTSNSLLNSHGTSTFTNTSITSLRLQADATNGIGTNSRFQLIKLK